jgi:hypothetical protein
MMMGRVAPFVVPTLVKASKQNAKVPHDALLSPLLNPLEGSTM